MWLSQEPCALELEAGHYADLSDRLRKLQTTAENTLYAQGFDKHRVHCEWHLNLRFRLEKQQSCHITIDITRCC